MPTSVAAVTEQHVHLQSVESAFQTYIIRLDLTDLARLALYAAPVVAPHLLDHGRVRVAQAARVAAVTTADAADKFFWFSIAIALLCTKAHRTGSRRNDDRRAVDGRGRHWCAVLCFRFRLGR